MRLRRDADNEKIDSLTDTEHKENKWELSICHQFMFLPFKKNRGNLVPGEMRQASNATRAEKIAGAMAPRFIGVAAYSVVVDEESGDMSSPRLLVKHGECADLNAA